LAAWIIFCRILMEMGTYIIEISSSERRIGFRI
jgi:hypothetical protein